jgi:hypothetical protein
MSACEPTCTILPILYLSIPPSPSNSRAPFPELVGVLERGKGACQPLVLVMRDHGYARANTRRRRKVQRLTSPSR